MHTFNVVTYDTKYFIPSYNTLTCNYFSILLSFSVIPKVFINAPRCSWSISAMFSGSHICFTLVIHHFFVIPQTLPDIQVFQRNWGRGPKPISYICYILLFQNSKDTISPLSIALIFKRSLIHGYFCHLKRLISLKLFIAYP